MSRLDSLAVSLRNEAEPTAFDWWVVRICGVAVYESHIRGSAVDVVVLAKRDREGLLSVFRRRLDALSDRARHSARIDEWDDVAELTSESMSLVAAYRRATACTERAAA